jgi:hypothetical protein
MIQREIEHGRISSRYVIKRRVVVTAALCLSACHRWRPETTPPLIGGGTATLRVETRSLPGGEAHRFTLRRARVAGDSILGELAEEHVRRGTGHWSRVRQVPGSRVAIATSDAATIARAELNPGRTTALVLGVGAVALIGVWFMAYLAYTGGDL